MVLRTFGKMPLLVGTSAKINANNGRGDEKEVLADFVCAMEKNTLRRRKEAEARATKAASTDEWSNSADSAATSCSTASFVSVGDRQVCSGPDGLKQKVNGRARCGLDEEACASSCIDLPDCNGYTHSEEICSGASWTITKGACFLHGPGLDKGLKAAFKEPKAGKPMKISNKEWQSYSQPNSIIGDAVDDDSKLADGFASACKRRVEAGAAEIPFRESDIWTSGEKEKEPNYLFDQGDEVEPACAAVIAAVMPDWMRTFGAAKLTAAEREQYDLPLYFVVAGPADAGVHFHQHNQAFNVLLTGSKRWWIFPPTTLPKPGPPFGFKGPDANCPSIKVWSEKYLPTLPPEARPIEFVQRAGDVLYVPDGWFHGTVQLEDTVGVALQIKTGRNRLHRGVPWTTERHKIQSNAMNPPTGQGFDEAMESMRKLWQGYIDFDDTSELAWLYKTKILTEQKKYAEARESGVRAAELGGRFHSPLAVLRGEIAVELAKRCASALSVGCPAAGSPAEAARALLVEARELFDVSIQLDPMQSDGWEQLRALTDTTCKADCSGGAQVQTLLDSVGFERKNTTLAVGPKEVNWRINMLRSKGVQKKETAGKVKVRTKK
eukprot:SAG22_NODE_119_length_19257_cov_43.260413_15_plen_607_part_00